MAWGPRLNKIKQDGKHTVHQNSSLSLAIDAVTRHHVPTMLRTTLNHIFCLHRHLQSNYFLPQVTTSTVLLQEEK